MFYTKTKPLADDICFGGAGSTVHFAVMTVAQFAQASLWEVFGHLVLGIILSGRIFIDAIENR